ncbi:F-box/kelch-repeat protein At3g23880-like [Coffea eugenioides]|nr:F-box/kelch-repeat protein At3g23880-like [Coffea eugenioides]
MEKYGVKESWTKVLSIPNLSGPNGGISGQAIFLSKEGEIVCKFGEVLALYDGRKILTFNLSSETFGEDVWRMEKYGVKESWTKVLSIPNLSGPNGGISGQAIFLSKEVEIVCKFREVLALYDPKHNTHMHMRITNLGALSQVNVYVESLVLPNAVEGVPVHWA